jgi:hypothetical protein
LIFTLKSACRPTLRTQADNFVFLHSPSPPLRGRKKVIDSQEKLDPPSPSSPSWVNSHSKNHPNLKVEKKNKLSLTNNTLYFGPSLPRKRQNLNETSLEEPPIKKTKNISHQSIDLIPDSPEWVGSNRRTRPGTINSYYSQFDYPDPNYDIGRDIEDDQSLLTLTLPRMKILHDSTSLESRKLIFSNECPEVLTQSPIHSPIESCWSNENMKSKISRNNSIHEEAQL